MLEWHHALRVPFPQLAQSSVPGPVLLLGRVFIKKKKHPYLESDIFISQWIHIMRHHASRHHFLPSLLLPHFLCVCFHFSAVMHSQHAPLWELLYFGKSHGKKEWRKGRQGGERWMEEGRRVRENKAKSSGRKRADCSYISYLSAISMSLELCQERREGRYAEKWGGVRLVDLGCCPHALSSFLIQASPLT